MSPHESRPAGVISGVVTDEHGRPLAEVAVSLGDTPVPVPDIAAVTGPDGTFVLAAPSPGSYTVVASGPHGGAARAQVQVAAGEEPTVVRLAIGAAGPEPG